MTEHGGTGCSTAVIPETATRLRGDVAVTARPVRLAGAGVVRPPAPAAVRLRLR